MRSSYELLDFNFSVLQYNVMSLVNGKVIMRLVIDDCDHCNSL